jgi:hypothetical protein
MGELRGVEALRVLLWVGAAVSEASPEQKAAIRERVFPLLEDQRSLYAVRTRIRGVMGRRWRPSGEWAEQLAALD